MYRLSLFGNFKLVDQQGQILSLKYEAVEGLVAYMALHTGLHRRETLAELFWGHTSNPSNNLRQALRVVRQAFESVDDTPYLLTGSGTLGFNHEAPHWLDVNEFSGWIEESERLSGQAKVTLLEKCAALYTGPVMSGAESLWLGPIRNHYEGLYAGAVESLMAHYWEKEAYRRAIDYCLQLTSMRPLDDNIHFSMMMLYLDHGDRIAALQVFEAFAQRLQDEFGDDMRPMDPMLRLHEQIKRGETWNATPTTPTNPIRLGAPFVDRDAERENFSELWDKTLNGNAQTLVVSGEAGVGKSRLMQHYEEFAKSNGGLVLRSRCYEQEQGVAYFPLTEALRHAINRREIKPKKVPESALSEIIKLIPELKEKAPKAVASPPLASTEQEHNRLLLGLSDTFAAIAEEQPIVLSIDDIILADDATLHAIHRIIRRCQKSKLLLLLSFREGDASEDHEFLKMLDELQPAHPIHYQNLQPLERQHIHEMVLGLLKPEAFPNMDLLLEQVFANAGGNAFFVGEFVRYLIDDGMLYQSDAGHWQFDQGKILSDTIPKKVNNLINGRLRRLSHNSQQLLELMAVIGRPLAANLLENLLGPWKRDLLQSFDDLQWRRFIDDIDGKIQFHHKMIRDAAYLRIGPTRRRQLHQDVASAFEVFLQSQHRDDVEFLGDAAFHFDQAKQLEKALHYYLEAGERMWRERFSQQAALRYFDRAIQLAKTLDNKPDLCRAYMGRCEVSASTSEYELGIEFGEKALAICDVAEQRGEILFNMANACHQLRQHENTKAHCEAALAEIDETQSPLTAIKVYLRLGTTLNWLQEFDNAIESFQSALKVLEQLPHDALKSQVLSGLGQAYSNKTEYQTATEHLTEAVELAKNTNDPVSIAIAEFSLGIAFNRIGEVDKAIDVWEQVVQSVKRYHNPQDEFSFYNRLVGAYLRKGDIEQALRCAELQLQCAQESQVSSSIATALGILGCILDHQGNNNRSNKCFRAMNAINNQGSLLYINMIIALLYLGNQDQALAWLDKGLSQDFLDDHQIRFLEDPRSIIEHPPLAAFQKNRHFLKLIEEWQSLNN